MNAKLLLSLAVILGGSTFAQLGVAQDAAAPAAEPAPAAPAGATPPPSNWLKVCEPLTDGKRACVMRQIVMATNGQFMGSFLLRDDPGQESRLLAVAAVPVGVMLPFNVIWQIDNNKPFLTAFMLCDKASCSTQLPVNELFVNSLKKGNKLTLTVRNANNEAVVIPIDLAGFTAAYDSAEAMTFDELNKLSSGDSAIQQTLQERAEAAKEKLESSTPQ
jgi:invasion protein IalB